jgi:ribose transport system ATP-binding protein
LLTRGLAGHGQTELLLRLFEAREKSSGEMVVKGRVSYVSGDRQSDGIFPLWSIVKNITICSYRQMRRRLLIDIDLEREMSCRWRDLIRIKTPDIQNNIFSLSGGNQQKVLFARALGSVAEIVLMDDPMRGVDVETKREVYDLIRAEADKGRCFIWYTTEMAELGHCDRVYVFQNNHIVSHLTRQEISENRILRSAFTGALKVCLNSEPVAAGGKA